MKKLLVYTAIIALMLGIASPYVVSATDKMYVYEVLEDTTICITDYLGNHDFGDETVLYIPEKIDGYTVSVIGPGAFAYSNLKTVVFPRTVHTIEQGAFYYNFYLKTVYLPAGLQVIEKDAFFVCPEMRALVIPDGVTTIGEYAVGYRHYPNPEVPNQVPGIVGVDTEFQLYVSSNSAAEAYAKEGGIAYSYASSLVKGDISLDGILDTTDIRELLHLIVKSDSGYVSWCDANNDGVIRTADARAHLKDLVS